MRTVDCIALALLVASGAPAANSLRGAWVTVVYGGTPKDAEYYEGARVALRSVRDTGTAYDRVALLSPEVPRSIERSLESDGVVVVRVPNVASPYRPSQGRFVRTLNKLAAWSDALESRGYERAVMLDADVLALANADELFECGATCVAFVNPSIFHTGVVVLTPSNATFQRMLADLQRLPSYDGADQGFLNSFFAGALAGPLFAGSALTPTPDVARLPFCYSMDHFFYYQRFRWELMTFPSMPQLKPWYWYSWPLMDLTPSWHAPSVKPRAKWVARRAWPAVLVVPLRA
eukprot:m51a1_g5106 putative glucuronosyltransferase pgsip8-like (290) ;mRNA; f:322553-323681